VLAAQNKTGGAFSKGFHHKNREDADFEPIHSAVHLGTFRERG
jgi:hypothetical protein